MREVTPDAILKLERLPEDHLRLDISAVKVPRLFPRELEKQWADVSIGGVTPSTFSRSSVAGEDRAVAGGWSLRGWARFAARTTPDQWCPTRSASSKKSS
jgi:hypothetical protein